jgi:membrane protein DedA with SNARE-associated domain
MHLIGLANENAQGSMDWIYHAVRHFLVSWGYWAVLIGVAGEDAGLPIPGETTLMFASFLAHKTSQLNIYWIIAAGTLAASMGDNIGFFLGRRFGETLIRWIKKIFRMDDDDIGAAKDLIYNHGGKTVYFARFIFGLRTVAGPLAGMLDMEWRRFFKFNLLGAATWVTTICLTGYEFANQFNSLLSYFEKASWALAGGLFTIGYLSWRRYKKKYKQKRQQQPKAA